jgi:hypothetical protein
MVPDCNLPSVKNFDKEIALFSLQHDRATPNSASPLFPPSKPSNTHFVAIRQQGTGVLAIVHSSPTTKHKEAIMNIAKNMEVIFIAALALVSMTGLASAAAQPSKLGPPEVVKVGEVPTMMVITITAKRLSAAEKAQLGD